MCALLVKGASSSGAERGKQPKDRQLLVPGQRAEEQKMAGAGEDVGVTEQGLAARCIEKPILHG